jgi:hypothetical protein
MMLRTLSRKSTARDNDVGGHHRRRHRDSHGMVSEQADCCRPLPSGN